MQINEEVMNKFYNGKNTKAIAKDLNISIDLVNNIINKKFKLNRTSVKSDYCEETPIKEKNNNISTFNNPYLKKDDILKKFKNGMNTKEISKILNVDIDLVESIISKQYRVKSPSTYKSNKNKETVKTKKQSILKKQLTKKVETIDNIDLDMYSTEKIAAIRNDYENGKSISTISKSFNITSKRGRSILELIYEQEGRSIPNVATTIIIYNLVKKDYTISKIRQLAIEGNTILLDKNIELALKRAFPNKELYYLSDNINKYNLKNNLIEEQERITKRI